MFWTKPMAVMLCLDVNVLVSAIRPDTSHHKVALTAIEVMRHGTEPVALLPEVAVGFLRVVTNRRIFTSPQTAAGQYSRASSAGRISGAATSTMRYWRARALT